MQYERVRLFHQEVLGLDVPVYDVAGVAPVDGLAELEDVALHEVRRQAIALVLEHLQQVPVHVLEHQVLPPR